MNEPIPFLEDWRFWQIVVTGALAFLGFFLAAWAKYLFDLRLDAGRREEEKAVRAEAKAVMAVAFRAELADMTSEAITRIHQVKYLQARTGPVTVLNVGALDFSPKRVFDGNTRRLGDFGRLAAHSMIRAHTQVDHIRNSVAAIRSHPTATIMAESTLEVFLNDLRSLFQLAAKGVNALDAFLGKPATFPDPEGELQERERAAALDAEADPAGPDAPEVPTE